MGEKTEKQGPKLFSWVRYIRIVWLTMLCAGIVPSLTGTEFAFASEDTYTCIEHDWFDWETVRSATITREGEQERVCLDCDETQTRTIAKKKPYVKLKKGITLKVGSTKKLKVSYAKGDKVKRWKSSRKSVVTVNSKGKLKARKVGTAKVTVTLKSGKKATCKVTVKSKKKRKLPVHQVVRLMELCIGHLMEVYIIKDQVAHH